MSTGIKRMSAFGIVAAMCLLFFALRSEAAFYEVRGKISWQNKVFRGVNAYLLYEKVPEGNSSQTAEVLKELPTKSFGEEYASLEKKAKTVANNVLDKKGAEQTQKELRRDLESLIKKYRERGISVDRKGEFYLNVIPDISYYILVVKKDALFAGDNHKRFWIYKIYFKPGDVLDAKEIIFNETNVVTW
jgi:hypothetical protein